LAWIEPRRVVPLEWPANQPESQFHTVPAFLCQILRSYHSARPNPESSIVNPIVLAARIQPQEIRIGLGQQRKAESFSIGTHEWEERCELPHVAFHVVGDEPIPCLFASQHSLCAFGWCVPLPSPCAQSQDKAIESSRRQNVRAGEQSGKIEW